MGYVSVWTESSNACLNLIESPHRTGETQRPKTASLALCSPPTRQCGPIDACISH